VQLEIVLVFSLASPEGGEGRGEEADGFTGSNPLTLINIKCGWSREVSFQ